MTLAGHRQPFDWLTFSLAIVGDRKWPLHFGFRIDLID